MDLIACLSTQDNSWNHVKKLIEHGEWSAVFLITDDEGKEGFKVEKEVNHVLVDFNQPAAQIIRGLQHSLQGKIAGFEVGVNLVSGNGKEHMAILSALLKLGLGIRLMALTKEGVTEL